MGRSRGGCAPMRPAPTRSRPAATGRASSTSDLLENENREDTIFRSKAVGEPPLMLAISVLHALSDAVASVADYRVCPRLDAPATPERVLSAIERLRASAARGSRRRERRLAAHLAGCSRRGSPTVLVTRGRAKGSTPREAGAAMLVTDERAHGTVGGGRLEWECLAQARKLLAGGQAEALGRGAARAGASASAAAAMSAIRLRRAGAAERAELEAAEAAAEAALADRAAVRRRPCRPRARPGAGASAAAAALDRRPRRRVPGRGAAGRRSDRHRPAAGRDRAGGARPAAAFRHDPQPRPRLRALQRRPRRGDFAYLGLIGSATKRAQFERGLRELGIPQERIAAWSARSAAGLRDKRPAVIAALAAAELLLALAQLSTIAAAPRKKGPHEHDGRQRSAAAPGAAGDHQALPRRGRQRRTSASRSRRARSTRCSARTAPARATLVKIIYGVLHPDEGEMLWDGEPVRVADPKAARALGIGMVFQHFSLFEAMTVLENIALGVDGVTDMKALAARVRAGQPRLRPAARPRPRGAHALGRRAPADRDRPLPAAEPAAPDHGRADLGADAAGGRAAVRDPAPARGRGLLDPLHQPQAGGDQSALRPRHHPARRQGGRPLRPQAETAREHGPADDRRRAPHAGRARQGGERPASRGWSSRA